MTRVHGLDAGGLAPTTHVSTAVIPEGGPERPYDIVFLDRDGTLNVRRPGYVDHPDDLVLLPGAADAVARLNGSGARVVLVTNQRGLATGVLDPSDLARVHEHLTTALARSGAHLDAIEVCPHEEGACACRKPGTGLFLRALRRAPWARAERCAMVGDMPTDVEPADALGMASVQIGRDSPDLAGAVDRLLRVGSSRRCTSSSVKSITDQ